MRHSPKYLKMLLMDSSLTRKLLPKCCSVMLYLTKFSNGLITQRTLETAEDNIAI